VKVEGEVATEMVMGGGGRGGGSYINKSGEVGEEGGCIIMSGEAG
jgi:hypothetical protein